MPFLVQTVTTFVHCAVHRGREEALVPARGDAHVVVAEAGRERMDGIVDPPPGAIEAHALEQPADEVPLAVDREVTVEQRVVDSVLVLFHNGDDRPQLRLQLVEQG